jgi:hypothetical protein
MMDFKKKKGIIRFEVFTAGSMKFTIFLERDAA